MVASRNTVEEVLKVVERHVGTWELKAILDDLVLIEGNQSFKDTTQRLRTAFQYKLRHVRLK